MLCYKERYIGGTYAYQTVYHCCNERFIDTIIPLFQQNHIARILQHFAAFSRDIIVPQIVYTES